MTLKPCRYCGKEPEVSFHPLPYFHGCWHIACENDACEKKPSTWYYYDASDAKSEWDELMSEAIKPCPFCGYEKPVVEVDECYPRSAWVECPLCEAKGPTEYISCGMTEEDAAVDAWNDANWRDA